MTPRTSIDAFHPQWESFIEFFLASPDRQDPFLVELHHERGTRTEWTVTEWRRRVLATAQWLAGRDVGPGSAVATAAGNTADALAVAYACWVTGACCVPLNPGDSLERLMYIVRESDVEVLVYSEELHGLADALAADTGVVLASASVLPRRTPKETGAESVGDPLAARPSLDAPALRVYTSGTTGEPKGVVLTAANLLVDCDALAIGTGWEAGTRVITVLPIHHVNGLVISSLLPWYAGFSTVLCDRFRSERFWLDIEAERAEVCSVVPSLLEFLLSSPGEPPACFREFVCGAGPLLVETVLDAEQRFDVPVRHLYGLSETTAVATLMPQLSDTARRTWHRDFGFPSIGPALPHVDVAVLDQTGAVVDAGQRGELVVRGAVVMAEYATSPEATAEVFRDGWFHSGDEGFWQKASEGRPYFFITGRLKELIIRGGSNISPFEIDSVLRTHPAVRFGLAIPFESRPYGEEIAAYVVADDGVSEVEILAHCARYLDHARCPKVIIFGDDVPYTATGKAKRLELKRRLAPALSHYRDAQFRRPRLGEPVTAPGPAPPSPPPPTP